MLDLLLTPPKTPGREISECPTTPVKSNDHLNYINEIFDTPDKSCDQFTFCGTSQSVESNPSSLIEESTTKLSEVSLSQETVQDDLEPTSSNDMELSISEEVDENQSLPPINLEPTESKEINGELKDEPTNLTEMIETSSSSKGIDENISVEDDKVIILESSAKRVIYSLKLSDDNFEKLLEENLDRLQKLYSEELKVSFF